MQLDALMADYVVRLDDVALQGDALVAARWAGQSPR